MATPLRIATVNVNAGTYVTAASFQAELQNDIDTYRLRPALHGLTRYLRGRPGDLQALLARGYVWERFLYFADALVDYKAAVAAHPDSVQARRKLAKPAPPIMIIMKAFIEYIVPTPELTPNTVTRRPPARPARAAPRAKPSAATRSTFTPMRQVASRS